MLLTNRRVRQLRTAARCRSRCATAQRLRYVILDSSSAKHPGRSAGVSPAIAEVQSALPRSNSFAKITSSCDTLRSFTDDRIDFGAFFVALASGEPI
jgi:hypothetical protein